MPKNSVTRERYMHRQGRNCRAFIESDMLLSLAQLAEFLYFETTVQKAKCGYPLYGGYLAQPGLMAAWQATGRAQKVETCRSSLLDSPALFWRSDTSARGSRGRLGILTLQLVRKGGRTTGHHGSG